MVFPLTVLKLCVKRPILVEDKSGETFNGKLVKCDAWMNIHLQDVILTSSTGDKFYKLKECYIKGSSIKYVRMGDEVMQAAMESNKRHAARLERERKEREKLQGGEGEKPPKKFQKIGHSRNK
jgi:U6 snRNA-associated Sm-like protein LSm4